MKMKTINGIDFYVFVIDCDYNNYFGVLHKWLDKHTTGKWITMHTCVGFEKEEDAIFYKLTHK